MTYATARAFREALETRLNRMAASGGPQQLIRLRRMVVFDRLLSRLLVVAPERWIVKGGFALDLRLGHRARVTQDLDLARQDTEAAATADFAAATEVDIAEKVHAYTRTHGDGRENTRDKDLIDLVLIPSTASFEAGLLRQALQTTFETRAVRICPAALPPPPAFWVTSYRRLATEVALEPDLAAGHRLAAAFLDDVRAERRCVPDVLTTGWGRRRVDRGPDPAGLWRIVAA